MIAWSEDQEEHPPVPQILGLMLYLVVTCVIFPPLKSSEHTPLSEKRAKVEAHRASEWKPREPWAGQPCRVVAGVAAGMGGAPAGFH